MISSGNTLVPSSRTKFKTTELKELPGWRGLIPSSQSKLTIESNVPLLLKSRSDYNRNILYPHWDLSSPKKSQHKTPQSSKASGSFFAVQPREESLNFEKQPQFEKIMGKNILTGSISARAQPKSTQAVIPVYTSRSQLGVRDNLKVVKVVEKSPAHVAVKNLNIGIKVKELPEKPSRSRMDQGMQASLFEGGIVNDFFDESVSRIPGNEATKELYDAYLNDFRLGEKTRVGGVEKFTKEKIQKEPASGNSNLKGAFKIAGEMLEEELVRERNEEINCLQLSFLTNADRSGIFGSGESRGNMNSYVEKGKSEVEKGSMGWRLEEDTHEGYSHQSTMITRSVLTRQKVEEVRRLPLKAEKAKIKHMASSATRKKQQAEISEAEGSVKKKITYRKINPSIKKHKTKEIDPELERSKSLVAENERGIYKNDTGKETLQPNPILVSPKANTPEKKSPQRTKPSELPKNLGRLRVKQKKKHGLPKKAIKIEEKVIVSHLAATESLLRPALPKSPPEIVDDLHSSMIPNHSKLVRTKKNSLQVAPPGIPAELKDKETVKLQSNFSSLEPTLLYSDQQSFSNRTPQKLLIIPERNVIKHKTNVKSSKKKVNQLKTQQTMPVPLEIDPEDFQKEGKELLASPAKSSKNIIERLKKDNSQPLIELKQPVAKPNSSIATDKPQSKKNLQPNRKSLVKSETTVIPAPHAEKISAYPTMKFLGINESNKKKNNSSRSSFSNSGFDASYESEDELPLDPEKIQDYRKKSLIFEIKALERLNTMEVSEKSPKIISRILSKRSSLHEKDHSEKLESLNYSDEIEEADIYTELAAFTYNKGSNRNLFTPQVTARFTQRKDLNNIGNINDIEINENHIDYNAIDNYMLKNRFVNSKSATTLSKNEANSKVEQLDLNSMLPIEIHKKKLKEFEKIRKREIFLKSRGEAVQIGGKTRTTFTNLQHPLPTFSAQPSPRSKIVQSGGSNSVRDQQHSSERHYCRLKDQFNLNCLSAPAGFSAEALLRSLDSNFLQFEKVYNK